MLSLLRKLIKRKPEKTPQTQHVRFCELDTWLLHAIERKQGALQQDLETAHKTTPAAIGSVKETLARLKSAQLLNANIPERAKQTMEGNRRALITRVHQFLEGISLPPTPDSIQAFFKDLDSSFKDLAKGIERPSQVLSHFFATQLHDVTAALASLEKNLARLRIAHDASGIIALSELNDALNALKSREKLSETLSREKHELKLSIKGIQARHGHYLSQQQQLRRHPALHAAESRAQECETRRERLAQEIRDALTPLEPAFKKYAYIAFHHRALIESYRRNCVEALAGDVGLKIAEILVGMQRALENDELGLRDRKKARIAQTIAALSHERLAALQTQYGNLSRDALAAVHALDDSPMQAKLALLDRAIAQTSKELNTAQRALAEKERAIADAAISASQRALAAQAERTAGILVTFD